MIIEKDLTKIYKAKKMLLEFFPFLSSSILYTPVQIKNINTPVEFTKDGIVINKKYNDLFDIFFLLLSSSFLYSLSLDKRVKGYYKVVFYFAASLYSNEIMVDSLKELGFNINDNYLKYKKLENFEDFKPLLYPEISNREDLYNYSIEEIYRILLHRLFKFKQDIENLILSRSKDYAKYHFLSEKLKSKILSEFFKDENLEVSIKKASNLTNHILNAIERYLHEVNLKKTDVELINHIQEAFKDLKIDSKGSGRSYIENLLKISKKYHSSFENLVTIFSKIASEYKNIFGKFDFVRINIKKYLVYKKHINKGGIIPSYRQIPIFKIFIALDSSGSIKDDQYILFVNALSYLLESIKNLEGKIFVFSTDIVSEIPINQFSYYNIISILSKRKGYGGTFFNNVIEKLKSEKDLNQSFLIILTDGLFTDSYIDIKTLEKLKAIILLTTNTIPKDFENLKNLKVVSLKF
ncbi:MAG: VWA domain-containing protein [Nanopusillaceae archaeon]